MARSVAIVGAGPAGMSAAIEAQSRGARVILIDEGPRPGGQIYRQAPRTLEVRDYTDPGERERKKKLLGAFERIRSSIDYHPNTPAFALFGRELHIAHDGRTEVLRADAVVLTSGVREIAVPFPGWTTPGVMYAGGLQALLKSQAVLAGKRIVVAGAGPLPLVVAAQIVRAGGHVAALATLNAVTVAGLHLRALWHGREIVREGLRYLWTVARAGVPRFTGYTPVRVLGDDHVEGVVLARIDRDGAVVPGSEREIVCDVVAVNFGFAANTELAAMAGLEMRYNRARGGWLPTVDAFGRTSVAGIFVAGDAAGLRGAVVAEAEGRIVGAAAASEPDDISGLAFRQQLGDVFVSRERHCSFQDAVQSLLRVPPGLWRLPKDDTVVCRCENVTAAMLRDAFKAGHLAPNTVKRTTRAGMGWCGGRTCLHAVAALLELDGDRAAAMMTPRPLARPVTFAALANQTAGAEP